MPYLLKKQKLLFNQTRNTQEINELVFIFHPCMSICSTKINICLHFAIIYLDRKSGDLKALISISDDRIFRTNMSSLHFLSMPPSLRFFSSFSSISCAQSVKTIQLFPLTEDFETLVSTLAAKKRSPAPIVTRNSAPTNHIVAPSVTRNSVKQSKQSTWTSH